MTSADLLCVGGQACSLVLDEWNGDGDLDAAGLQVLHVEREGVAVETLQPCAHVGEADAGGCDVDGRKARAVVVDRERECAIVARGGDAHEAAMSPFGDAMFDGVFNHELQDQRGNLRDEEIAGNVDGELKAIDEADLLDVEILLSELHLFGERNLLARRIGEERRRKSLRPAIIMTAASLRCSRISAGDGVECVEEEVRLNLAAERVELRLGELLVQASGLGLLAGEASARVEYRVDGEDGAVEDDGGEDAVGGGLKPESVERLGGPGCGVGVEQEALCGSPGGETEVDDNAAT